MKIAIRVDDLTPTMDRAPFSRFVRLCDQYDVKPLLGIIPDNRDPALCVSAPDPAFWDEMLLLQKNGYVLAMHGCHHVYRDTDGGLFPLNRFSEFTGLSEEEQFALLQEGRAALLSHGIATDLFMAPAHNFDGATLRALVRAGFTGVTDGFGKAPYRRGGLTFYPISFRKKNSLAGGEGVTTLVVHPATMTEADFAEYETIFQTQDMLPFGDYLAMPAVCRTSLGSVKEALLAEVKRRLVERHAAH